jgi:hypothetical protein
MNCVKPFFESTPVHDTSSRLLLVSYHFPPGTSAGALRWEKLSRFFVARGWGLDVVTRDPQGQPDLDWQRLRNLPGNIRVFGIPESTMWMESIEYAAWRAFRKIRPGKPGPVTVVLSAPHAPVSQTARSTFAAWPPRRLSDAIRGYYAWLDYARTDRWAQGAARLALKIVRPGIHAAVITCGPPHMAHVAGPIIARTAGLPHIMDLRDPWSLVERLPENTSSELSLRLARRYERTCVRDAALIVLNTELARRAMQEHYPEIRSHCISVMNGYDDDPVPPPQHDSRFLVAYAGTIYLDRNPRSLLRACAQLVAEQGLSPDQLGLEFIGKAANFNGFAINELARREGLDPAFVSVIPFLPRPKLVERLSRAAVLVNLPQDSHLAIPSKVFEYLRFHAWLLVLEDEGSATELLLRNSGADVVSPGDVVSINRVLRMRYSQFTSGIRPEPLAGHLPLSRRSQAERFLDAIESIVPDNTIRPAKVIPVVEH